MRKVSTLVSAVAVITMGLFAQQSARANGVSPQIKGQYLETRSADVYVGQCFANGEVNTTGQEAIVAWHIAEGQWDGVPLNGLTVVGARL